MSMSYHWTQFWPEEPGTRSSGAGLQLGGPQDNATRRKEQREQISNATPERTHGKRSKYGGVLQQTVVKMDPNR